MLNGLLNTDPNPPSKARLNFNQINEWNKYMQNNPQGDLTTLYSNYKKTNPKTTIPFDALRNELDLLTQKVRTDATNKNEMIQDGAHTGNQFIHLKGLNGQDYGAMNGEGMTQGPPMVNDMPASMIKNNVPDWVDNLEWNSERNQPYYKDGNDIVYVDKKFYNSPRFIKPQGMMNGLIAKTR